jgi:hypothetical protein
MLPCQAGMLLPEETRLSALPAGGAGADVSAGMQPAAFGSHRFSAL